MFSFMRTSPIGGSVNYRDYTFEGDGHLYAFQEAFHDLAEVDGMFADMNCQGVDAFAKGYHNGGLTVARESADAFMKNVVMEGFFGNVKDRLIKLLKTLKEKIKSFFHSAVQYFDAFFKDGAAFAEKYEDELRDKDLDGFKVRMYTYKALSKDYSKTVATWEDMKKAALAEAKRSEIDITTEAFGFDGSDWVGCLALLSVVREYFLVNGSMWTQTPDAWQMSRLKKKGWKEVDSVQDAMKDGRTFQNASNMEGRDDIKDSDSKRKMYGSQSKSERIRSDWDGQPWMKDEHKEESPKEEETEKKIILPWKKDDHKDETSEKETEKTTVKSITSAQRKQIRRVCMHALSTIDNADYGAWHKQLKKAMRDGVTTAKEITPDISDMIDTLKNSKEQLSDIKDIGDKFQDEFDSEIDKVKDMDKSGDNAIRVRNHVAVFTEAKNVFMEYFQVLKSVMIERNNAYKSCLSAALHYDSKNK